MVYNLALLLAALTPLAAFAKKYGSAGCQCVGIDVGNAVRPFAKTDVDDKSIIMNASFPAEIGTSCDAWDAGHHPKCTGEKDQPSFCEQKWCYVDPCECDSAISASTYLPSWKYHKRPLHYSYKTCGGKQEEWFKQADPQHVTVTKAQCNTPETGIGSPTCPCVGMSGRTGHITLMYAGEEGPYKAELGSFCSLWDLFYPPCTVHDKDGKIPEWCSQTWCYVDPCNCKGIEEAPRPTQKIQGSSIHGAPMYFSFNTCGDNYLLHDGWVEKSCWTMKTQTACEGHKNLLDKQCGWLDGQCIDGDLLPICSKEGQAKREEL